MRTRPSYADIFQQNYKKNTIGIFKKKILFFLFFRLTKSDNALYSNHNPPTT